MVEELQVEVLQRGVEVVLSGRLDARSAPVARALLRDWDPAATSFAGNFCGSAIRHSIWRLTSIRRPRAICMFGRLAF